MLHILKPGSLKAQASEEYTDYETEYLRVLRHGGFTGEARHYETAELDEYPDNVRAGDTVLIGGSKSDAWADDEVTLKLLEFTKQLIATEGVRLIGVCYGHQMIARALGAEVGRAAEWELTAKNVRLTEKGRELFPEVEESHALQQVHRDQVFTLPPGAALLMTTKQCPIQAFYVPNKCLCLQGHPEFTTDIVRRIVENIKHSDPDAYDVAMRTIDDPDHGLQFGYALTRFVRGQC